MRRSLLKHLTSAAVWFWTLLSLLIRPGIAESTDNWTTFHHDVNRTGFSTSPMPNPTNMTQLWSYQVPGVTGSIYSSPAAVDGYVYFTARDRRMYCLDAATGALQWQSMQQGSQWNMDYPSSLGPNLDSSPAVGETLVFVGARDGRFYAYDKTTGFEQWSRDLETDGVVVPSPLLVNNGIFVGSADIMGHRTTLHWLRASDGWLLDSLQFQLTPELMVVSPTLMQSEIAFGSGNLLLSAQIRQGVVEQELQWSGDSFDTQCVLRSSPCVVGDKVYLGDGYNATPNGLVCLNTGLSPVWTMYRAEYEWTCGTAAFHADSVFVPGGGEGRPDIYCVVDLGTGWTMCWEADLGAVLSWGQPVSPAITSRFVFMAVARKSVTGQIVSFLCCLDARTGFVVREFNLGSGRVRSSPAIWEGKVYIGTADGRLLCFG